MEKFTIHHQILWRSSLCQTNNVGDGASHRFLYVHISIVVVVSIGTTLGLILRPSCLWVSCYYWRII